MFLTYPDAPQAEYALTLNGMPFGKGRSLYFNRFSDIEKYATMPVGTGELPSGWKERGYHERVSLSSSPAVVC
jgi:translation initiation factor 3 subunit B